MDQTEDEDMERTVRDVRKWHTTKEVPLALIWMGLVFVFTAGGAYMANSIKNDAQDKQILEAITELRDLRKQWQDGSVPSAQMAWKVQQADAAMLELKSRMAENERQDVTRDNRIQRLENGLGSTNARVRARDER